MVGVTLARFGQRESNKLKGFEFKISGVKIMRIFQKSLVALSC